MIGQFQLEAGSGGVSLSGGVSHSGGASQEELRFVEGEGGAPEVNSLADEVNNNTCLGKQLIRTVGKEQQQKPR